MFQPTKRPQVASQKPKPKSVIQKPPQFAPPPPPPAEDSPNPEPPKPQPKSTLADWTAGDDDDVNGFFGAEKRQRGGRKKRKKNKEEEQVVQNWDDIYDPSRPNNYEEYKNSDERIAEIRDWKDRLYAHRMARRRSSDLSSDEGRGRATSLISKSLLLSHITANSVTDQFAPPPMSFAPPPNLNDSTPPPPPPPPPAASVPDDPSGEEAYRRRLALSQQFAAAAPPPPPPTLPTTTSPSQARGPSDAPPPIISRAPVRYSLPPAPSELPSSEAELASVLEHEVEQEATERPNQEPSPDAQGEPRSIRPGQKGFAQRLMSKYGWTKGTGLGVDNSGILNPLSVKVEKAKKKSDAEGGGTVGPKGGLGRIVGGKKSAATGDKEGGKFGIMSEVVMLKGMVDGMDLPQEVEDGLIQEIGEECGEKYGRVERVYIHQPVPSREEMEMKRSRVFVKFTSQLSALRVSSNDPFLGHRRGLSLRIRTLTLNC